jgi:hypothetical protein
MWATVLVLEGSISDDRGVGVVLGVLTVTVRGEEVGCIGEEPQVTGAPDNEEEPTLPEFTGVLGTEGLARVLCVCSPRP